MKACSQTMQTSMHGQTKLSNFMEILLARAWHHHESIWKTKFDDAVLDDLISHTQQKAIVKTIQMVATTFKQLKNTTY